MPFIVEPIKNIRKTANVNQINHLISDARTIEDFVLYELSSNLHKNLIEVLQLFNASGFLPQIDNDISIVISEKTLVERIAYFKDSKQNSQFKVVNPRTSFVSKKIWIPIDLLDHNKILTKNIDSAHDLLLTLDLAKKCSNFFSEADKDSLNKIITSVTLGHEVGHCYLTKIFHKTEFDKIVHDQKIPEQDPFKLWARLFSETFADRFSTMLTKHSLNLDNIDSFFKYARDLDRDSYKQTLNLGNSKITPNDRLLNNLVDSSALEVLKNSLNNTNEIFNSNCSPIENQDKILKANQTIMNTISNAVEISTGNLSCYSRSEVLARIMINRTSSIKSSTYTTNNANKII